MTTARELLHASTRELREHIVHGHPVDPHAIEGWAYRGTSLGLPSFVERLTWKTFQKTFHRDSAGRLVGWNVRLEQDGIDSPSRPKLRRGRPVTEWHYEVIEPRGVPTPPGFDRGLIIDYSRGPNPPGPVRLTKDPLVSLSPDDCDELLGVSYLVVSGRCVETPTYFTLERDHPIDFVPYDEPASPAVDPLRLSSLERGWAEQLFAAIVATGGDDGLPSFASVDRSTFWRCFEEAPSPLVRAGLRPMVHTLTFLPVVSGFGKPFFLLSPDERERFLAQAASSRRMFVRQALVTLKTLACFAYFDDPAVRARHDEASRPGGDEAPLPRGAS
ncbi:MAG: hypothetical protein HYV09_27335 [Deltaproteobacteria bacterium]|nr:hypothetical protein [Deltaproteobacteria bacterium]